MRPLSSLVSLIRRLSITFRRQVYRTGQWQGRARTARNALAFLGMIYTFFFSFVSLYGTVLIVMVLLSQLGDRKQKSLVLFPSGLTDAVTVLPLAVLAFAGLLFAAQGSVSRTPRMANLYGYAGRAMLSAFYFLTLSLILSVASRIVYPQTFDNVRVFGPFLHWLTSLFSGLIYVDVLVAGCFAFAGLVAFGRSFSVQTN